MGKVTSDQAPRLTPPPGVEVHVVRRGESLSRIAKKHKVEVQQLIAANRELIKDPDVIQPNWKLIIPGKAVPVPLGVPTPAAPVAGRTVVDLSKIAPNDLRSTWWDRVVSDLPPWLGGDKALKTIDPEMAAAYHILANLGAVTPEERTALRGVLGLAAAGGGEPDVLVPDRESMRNLAAHARVRGMELTEAGIEAIKSKYSGALKDEQGVVEEGIGPLTTILLVDLLLADDAPNAVEAPLDRPATVQPTPEPRLFLSDGISERIARAFPQLAYLAARPTAQWRFPAKSSAPVESLQRLLNRLGAQPPLAVDGDLGAATRTQVRKVMSSLGLAGDPTRSPQALRALLAAAQTALDGPPPSRVKISVDRTQLSAQQQGAYDLTLLLAREHPAMLSHLRSVLRVGAGDRRASVIDAALVERLAERSAALGYSLDAQGQARARRALYIGTGEGAMSYELASGLTFYLSTMLGTRGIAGMIGAGGAPPSKKYIDRSALHDRHFFDHARGDVSPALLKAVATMESELSSTAGSHKGAQGLMQFMSGTAKTYRLKNRRDARESVRAARDYLKYLLAYPSFERQQLADRNGLTHTMPLAIASYNTGEGNVSKHNGMAPYGGGEFGETRPYVPSILLLAGLYAQRDEPPGAREYATARQAENERPT